MVPAGMCSGCAQTARGCRRDPVRPLKTAHPLGHSVGDTVRSLVELGCVGDLRWSNKGRCRPLLDRRRRSPVVVGSDRVCSGRRQVAANSSFFLLLPLSASTCALSPPPLEFTVGAAHRIPAPPHSCPATFLPHRIPAPSHSCPTAFVAIRQTASAVFAKFTAFVSGAATRQAFSRPWLHFSSCGNELCKRVVARNFPGSLLWEWALLRALHLRPPLVM